MSNDKYIPLQRTIFTEVDLVHAIVSAYKTMFGKTPFIQEAGIFWAHFALECGKGKACYNWNIGNIKYSPGHNYTMYACGEKIDGKEYHFTPPHFQTWFRSYSSLSEAVAAHFTFLKSSRYASALLAATALDPDLYVEELKKGGYFTADLERYKGALKRLFEEFMSKYTQEIYDDPYEE